MSQARFQKCVFELAAHGRIHRDDSGTLFIKRMVRDEEIRASRADGGKFGGNPKLTIKVNLDERPIPHARMRADRLPSDSDSSFSGRGAGEGLAEDDISQIKRWLYEFMGEGWPEPDFMVCEQVYVSMNGASMDQLALFLRQLHKQGKRPQKSWAWFIGVVQQYFARKANAN